MLERNDSLIFKILKEKKCIIFHKRDNVIKYLFDYQVQVKNKHLYQRYLFHSLSIPNLNDQEQRVTYHNILKSFDIIW